MHDSREDKLLTAHNLHGGFVGVGIELKKRTAAIFLTLALCLTLLPTAALAAEGDTVVVKPEIEYGGDYINCTTDTVIDVSDVSSAGTIYVTVKNEGCTITLTGPDFPAGARAGGGGALA